MRSRQDIHGHYVCRKGALDVLVKLQADAGASGRMPDYRWLIDADVDEFVGMLLEVRTVCSIRYVSLMFSKLAATRAGGADECCVAGVEQYHERHSAASWESMFVA
jgi:hypothetical protein